jgi:hypothetical protein
MVMSSTCMKVPSERPIVASDRLAGRNSPNDGTVVAAFEAMKFPETVVTQSKRLLVKNKAMDGRGEAWIAKIDSLARDWNRAAIRDDRKNK